MYFKEKEDTNIDAEFNKNKKTGLDFKNLNLKPIIFIAIGIIALLVIIFFVASLGKNKNAYTIELAGSESIIINLGSEYTEPGYTAYDSKGNNVTSNVKILNTIDTSQIGEYEVLYSIGSYSVTRKVTVTEAIDATYIHLNGSVNMVLEVGEKYIEEGWDVFDSVDRNLTEKVEVSGTVDTSKVGVYQITYTVVNSRNVTTTMIRTIKVVDKK